MCGIPPCRGNIIRPLIEVTRSEIEAYCREQQLTYVTDSTNLTKDYSRNRIRWDVVPVLKELNPSLESAVSGLSQRMRETEAYLSQAAEAALIQAKVSGGYAAAVLQTLPEAVFAAAVRKLCAELALIPEAKHLALLHKIVYNGGAVEIGGGVTAVMSQGIFRIYRQTLPQDEVISGWQGQQALTVLNKKIDLLYVNIEEFHNGEKNHQFLLANSLDYDTIPITSCFRARRSGDQLTLWRRNVTKSVKKLLIECKVPREQRDSIVLLADGTQVLWLEGIGVGQAYAVTEATKSVLVIRPQNV